MNEQTKELLTSYLQSVSGKMSEAVEFGEDQVPLYVQELISLGFFNSITSIIINALVILASIIVAIKMTKWCKKICEDENHNCQDTDMACGATFFVLVAGFIVCIIGSTLIVDSAKVAYKCKYAPRVYIVEKISELVK